VESNRSDEEMETEEEKEGNVSAQVTEREQGTASQETEAGEKEANVEAQATETVQKEASMEKEANVEA